MEALRQVPPINDILASDELAPFRGMLRQPFATRCLQDILTSIRNEITGSASGVVVRSDLTRRIAAELALRLRDSLRPSLRRVINATGVVLHTNLGRAPLPASALDHVREVGTHYSNLEYDVDKGKRGNRDGALESTLRKLLKCDAGVITNNNAAAVLLILNTLADGGEVIVSRGELVEIGGSFRIPEIMMKSGGRLREVGTTNRTRISDYEAAINDDTRLLLRVHPSNFRITGFTERPTLSEFVALGRKYKLPTCEDLGSGCMLKNEFADEPLVADSIDAGIDLVCFSGDKLIGGPQAGIIAGKKLFVERLRRNPLFRALRVDKLTLAALESVLLSHLSGALDDIPVSRMLRAQPEEIKSRAVLFAGGCDGRAMPVELSSIVGGGSAPETTLPSWGVVVRIEGLSNTVLEDRLRQSDPPVIVRTEKNRVVLDFRTVMPEDEEKLRAIILAV